MNAKPGSSRSFSPAFEHLCSFVAVSSTQRGDEVLRQLLLHCIVILPNERFHSATHFKKCLDTLFGLQMPMDRLQAAIEQLIKEEKLYRPGGTFLAVKPDLHSALQRRIDEASALQDRVKTKWLDDSAGARPKLDRHEAWAALQRYLSGAFRRHGMQTVALLGAFDEIATDYFDSLQSILRDALPKTCGTDQRADVEASIKEFLATVGSDPD